MYGLIMLREYLDEIIEEKKSYDARAYYANKRGTIALIDSKKSIVVGLVDLVRVHKIDANEYCDWHATGRWSGLKFQVEDMTNQYYAWDFKNPRLLIKPVKIDKKGKVWVELDNYISEVILTNTR